MAETLRSPPTPADSGSEGWRSLLALSGYRWALLIFLTLIYYSGNAAQFLGGPIHPWLFEWACLGYLLLCVPMTVTVLLHWPAMRWQVYSHAALDVAVLTVLIYAGGGVQSGLAVLLITPVAGASMLLPRRMALLLGALASLGLLGEEVYRQLRSTPEASDFLQAGILGLLYFFAAWVANTLALRARSSEALAARRKTALDNLSQLNERIIQSLQLGVLVVDAGLHIRLLNLAASRLLGSRPGAVGRPLQETAPELAEALLRWRGNPLRETGPVTLETPQCTLLAQFSRLGAEADTPVLVFFEDAGRIGEQAQQMKLAALGRLTASLAHEIRNPLGAISHASQLLDEAAGEPAQNRRLLEIIHRHTGRINTLVEDILGLSRRGNAVPETLRLRPWLEQVTREYAELCPVPAPQFDLEQVSPAVEVRADPGQLRQVLANLWDNAREHSGLPAAQLRIQLAADTWQESGRSYLDVSDNGRGISPEVASHIFEPFYTTTHRGTGLGLYIAHELCECNYAKLSHSPGGDSGARFRIVFAHPGDWLAQEGLREEPARLARSA